MKIFDILNEPWLIIPEKLRTIQDIYLTHLHGEKLSQEDLNTLLDKTKDIQINLASSVPSGSGQARKAYDVVNGTAIIPIAGVIAKRLDLFTAISGGVSTERIASLFKAALADSDVTAIFLDIDSPGGTVDGTQELANTIYNARGKKPVVSFTDGMMASAAYWIGSAADRIYINGDTTWMGSIGVVTEHMDISKWEEMKGYKTTEITAGRYKRITSQYGPLSEEGRADLQQRVDVIYDLFTREVAQFRGTDQQKIKDTEARIYLGKEAIKALLADGVSAKERLMSRMSRDPQNFIRRERIEAQIIERRLQCQNN